MSYPLPPGGLFPLTTAPTGRNAGGQYPLPAVLSDAIRSLAPTAYWKMDEASGNLADAMSGGHTATVTGSPTYGVAAPSPIGRGVTFSGTGQYAVASASVPTPASSVSVMAIFSTTDSTAAGRVVLGRGQTSQHTWDLRLTTGHAASFIAKQSDGSNHAVATPSGAINDGSIHLVTGTFDGTTVWCARDGTAATSSTSLTGTWHKASTAVVTVACLGAGSFLFPGTVYAAAYWADRVITDAERLWVYSIMAGG